MTSRSFVVPEKSMKKGRAPKHAPDTQTPDSTTEVYC
jgi:hypothetical protein